MRDTAAVRKPMTVEEYCALEETSSVRHEYIDGTIHAMTGGTRRHNRIALNIARRLIDAVGDGPCRVYMESVRVRVSEQVFYYPDVVVACGEPGDAREEDSPCVVVEVLSPSTETTDRREKAIFYRRKPGLKAYLMVHQDQRWVEAYFLGDDGIWDEGTYAYDDDSVPIPCPVTRLALADIYAGVEREGGGPLRSRPPLRVREHAVDDPR